MDSAVMFEETCSFNGEANEKQRSTSRKRREKKVEGKDAKCELVGFDSLPEYLKDNEFILNHYRSEWPMKETVLSIFSMHNETLNIWTHLIGFFIFLALTISAIFMLSNENFLGSPNFATLHFGYNIGYTITLPLTNLYNIAQVANVSSTTTMGPQLGRSPITRWPFFAFLLGAMVCLLTSSLCHLLMCHSEKCAYKMLRLDYTGIATLIVTSFYPVVYYPFMCDPLICTLYISFITVFGLATVLVSLVPAFQAVEFRPFRALLFVCMAVSGLVPITHKVIAMGHRPEAIITARYESLMGLFYGLGVVIYVARVPERWMPGKFDVVGHSHQLFHVLVIAGAHTHYLAGLEYLKWRDTEGCYA
ncbi:uncharacterized protein A4U43_C08F11150 [Asparagus officinalis]|uniref:heptahelical transmembrane protein 4-like n=1 Tax=Asparagus officinalis TaxID=4686 RepID=UPI00098E7C0E|nr:heptahelical transmembrane protein 4-like [Asparagus officinalis]ONK59820.1 uncharacterized protein A4U43_C08F11150 [Asparagus officinalis]